MIVKSHHTQSFSDEYNGQKRRVPVPDWTRCRLYAPVVDVVRGQQNSIRREDSGQDSSIYYRIGMLDPIRMVCVLWLVGKRLPSAAGYTGTRNGCDNSGRSDLGEAWKRRWFTDRVGVPQQTGFCAVRGQPKLSADGDNDRYYYYYYLYYKNYSSFSSVRYYEYL